MPVLTKVGGVVERRQTLPILGNLLLNASEESLSITATDLEVEVRSKVNAVIDGSGDITVPARKFIDICRALPDSSDIGIKIENQKAIVKAGRSRFTLSTLPASDYPLMDSSAGDNSVEIAQGILKDILEKTSFAMGHQDVRYYLNGLFFRIRGGGVTAVATDGHRMAMIDRSMDFDVEKDIDVILPRKTVLELSRLLDTGDSLARLDLCEKTLRAYVGDTVLTSKLVDGRYPDYKRVIPKMVDKMALVDRESFRQSLMRTSILSNEKFKGVRLNFEDGKLSLQAHNPEQEVAEEEMEIDYEYAPTEIGFNVGYLLDILNVLDDSEVEVAFSDSGSSALLRNKGRDEQTFVVMPMRL